MGDSISELQRLVGDAVFIRWPRGKKGDRQKWKHLTLADMTPAYLDSLEGGNIGVALGQVSGGLCAVDIDVDHFVGSFEAVNPQLVNSLQTHGARGRVFWMRFTDNYPKRTIKLRSQAGEDIGEFRSNGAQSIIHGTHPDTAKPYVIVNRKSALWIPFKDIVWPTKIANPPSTEPECTEVTDVIFSSSVFFGLFCTRSVPFCSFCIGSGVAFSD